jgi:hypothetical protein
MRGKFLHVEQHQAVRGEDPLDGREREVTEVLVIDGVELVVRHELLQVRELHGDDAVWRQQDLHAGNEIVEIGHVGQHVVPEQQAGRAMFRPKPRGGVPAKELGQVGMPFRRAASATLAAGSIPRTGIPMARKCCSR